MLHRPSRPSLVRWVALLSAIASLAVVGATAQSAGATVATCSGTGSTFAGGAGTSADPYLVSNQAQLEAIRSSTYRTCAFLQTNHLSLSGAWTSIGTGSDFFTGEYDGGNYRISGLSITTGSGYEGLFGYTGSGAVIKNIRLSGTVNLPGVFGVGALVGLADRPTTITNVHSSVDVSGGSRAGGLVGWLAESTIRRSSSTGTVTGNGSNIGGLVGFARSSYGAIKSEITDSYARGAVVGGGGGVAGGLIGGVEVSAVAGHEVVVADSYAAGGSVSGGTTGGLIGEVSGASLTVTDSFWDTETTGQSSSAGGIGKTTAQMKSFSTFNNASWNITDGWSASTVWSICNAASYPFLSDQYSSLPCGPPLNIVPPSTSGTARVGHTLTANRGIWTAEPPVPSPAGYSYQWQSCETDPAAGAGVNWTTRTAPSSFGWRSIAWGADKFVAVGGDVGYSTADDVLTSPDGVTWTPRTAVQNNYWQSVAWGGPPGQETFVAVSPDGTNRVMTSPDGITWTARSAAAAKQWKSITWGGPTGQKKFVAVAEDGGIMTSPDGTNWTTQTDPVGRDWRSVTWGGDKFVAIAYSGPVSGQVMTSPDGVNWTSRSSAVANGWFGVTWGGTSGQEKFVAVSLTGDGNQVMISPDGVTWTASTSPAGTRQWHSVAWGGLPGEQSFVAVSDTGAPNQVMTSPDGVTWTVRSSSSPEKWRAVTWGGPAGQEKFASVAYDQPSNPPTDAGAGPNRVMTSEATVNCTNIGANAPTYTLTGAEEGKKIRVKVTATNSSGSADANSALTAPIAPAPPPPPPPPPTEYVLSVAKAIADTGTGTVTSSPAGIDCGTTCQRTFDPGTQVTLTATPDLGSRFTGWTGACTNQSGPCTLTMTDTKVVTARFTAVDTYRLTVSKQGTGQGSITSTPVGIDCGTTCESSFNDGEEVTLTASAAEGSAFTGWTGACTGTAPCQVTMNQARQVTATFQEVRPSYMLNVTRQGTGQGAVISNPSGINCGTACEASYEGGTGVTLTASASAGSTFSGWTGACTNQTGTCQVTMSQARQVTATFISDPPVSEVKIKLNTSKPAKVPSSRVVKAVRVSCVGGAPCRIDRAKAKAKAGGGSEQKAPVTFNSDPFPAGASRIIQVTIPKSVYKKLKKGKKSGLLTVEVRAQGTEGPRDKTIKVGLER